MKILKSADLLFLSLLILSLPSLEAPKNIFLVLYLITRILHEYFNFHSKKIVWSLWDNLFLFLIVTALLSTIFAGMPHLEEWKGFRVFLCAILTGWLLSRAQYTNKNMKGLFILIILATIPPLIWGLFQYFILHTKPDLQLNSVGHVNHSAIYLVMIFGASLGLFLTTFRSAPRSIFTITSKQFSLAFLSLVYFLSLIISQSRGAFGIGILLGLTISFLVSQNKKIKWRVILAMIVIIFCTLFFKTGIIQKQITNEKNNNVLSFRDKVWNVSIEASHFSPLLGIGLSNWHFITLQQLKDSKEKRGEQFNVKDYFFPGHSHNLYLSALVERGIIGLLVTLIFMGIWAQHLFKTYFWAKNSNLSLYLWTGSLSAWIATFGIGFVNTTFHHEHAILACLFLGLFLSFSRQHFRRA